MAKRELIEEYRNQTCESLGYEGATAVSVSVAMLMVNEGGIGWDETDQIGRLHVWPVAGVAKELAPARQSTLTTRSSAGDCNALLRCQLERVQVDTFWHLSLQSRRVPP